MKEVKIVVTVGKDGGTVIEAQGFKDAECLKETKELEEALGKVEGRTKKAEASVPPVGDKTKVKVGC